MRGHDLDVVMEGPVLRLHRVAVAVKGAEVHGQRRLGVVDPTALVIGEIVAEAQVVDEMAHVRGRGVQVVVL